MDVAAVGAVVMETVGAAEVIDGLAGEGFRGEAGAGDDDLAVGIAISGVCGLETRHYLGGWKYNLQDSTILPKV